MTTNYHHESCYVGKEKPHFPMKDCRQCELLDQIDASNETIENLLAAHDRIKNSVQALEAESARVERLYSNGI